MAELESISMLRSALSKKGYRCINSIKGSKLSNTKVIDIYSNGEDIYLLQVYRNNDGSCLYEPVTDKVWIQDVIDCIK
jgi:hypothetical protein